MFSQEHPKYGRTKGIQGACSALFSWVFFQYLKHCCTIE